MSSSNKPCFLVAGATGAQGGAIINSLLKTNNFCIRGITHHDLESAECRALKNKGVDMVRCDFTNRDDLKRALKDVDIFFAMTDCWEPSQQGREYEIGKMQVDCAKECNVKHFIWSYLPNVESISKGKIQLPSFTDKAKVGDYALKNLPTTLICPGFYFQNFETIFKPERGNDGTLTYTLPMAKKIAAFDVNDMGEAVCTIVKNRDKYLNKIIPLYSEELSPEQFIKSIQEVTGNKARLNSIPHEEFTKRPNGKELSEMFRWMDQYGYFGPDIDTRLCKEVCPNLKNWRQYLQVGLNPK